MSPLRAVLLLMTCIYLVRPVTPVMLQKGELKSLYPNMFDLLSDVNPEDQLTANEFLNLQLAESDVLTSYGDMGIPIVLVEDTRSVYKVISKKGEHYKHMVSSIMNAQPFTYQRMEIIAEYKLSKHRDLRCFNDHDRNGALCVYDRQEEVLIDGVVMHEAYDTIIRSQHVKRKYQLFRNDKQKYKDRNTGIGESSFDLSDDVSGNYSKFQKNHGISQKNRMKALSQQEIPKILYLDPSLSTSPSMKRTARNSNSINATVEILVWTDYSFYKYFTALEPGNAYVDYDILRYVATLVNAADVRMKKGLSRDPSLKISIVLSGVVICKTSNCSWFIDDFKKNNTVDNHVALDHFAETLQSNYETNKLHFRYDFAAALTKLDLTDPNGVPIGVANADDICHLKEGESSAVIEDQGAFSSVGTLVHEMAHTLGSDHDGWFRSENCSSEDGYIMSTLSPLSPNGFFFSPCSIKSIKENLIQPNASCLFDPPQPYSLDKNLTSLLPGQIYNRTQQCKQVYGTRFCLSVGTKLEDICYKMYCWDPILPNVCSTRFPAALGTSCGPNKWCVGGECVHDNRAPNIPNEIVG